MPRRKAEYFGFSLHALERAAREGFQPVPGDLEARLSTVRNRDDLKRLVTAAARAADLAAFRRELEALSSSGA
jgi:hypothetical protein